MLAAMIATVGFLVGGHPQHARSAIAAQRCGAAVMATRITQGEVHGERGAYVGGYWVPLEDCAEQFNIKGGSGEQTAKTPCPRSITRHSAAKTDGSYDVVIIGAGCIGAAVARELSKTTASVLMIESADDVCQGATKGNSGIVHAGFDDTPGSVRAKLCWKGNQMFPGMHTHMHIHIHKHMHIHMAIRCSQVCVHRYAPQVCAHTYIACPAGSDVTTSCRSRRTASSCTARRRL